MTKFVTKKNFFIIFQIFGTYFLEKITNRNWGYLIHEGSTDRYISNLVEEYYNNFTNNDIDNHAHMIHINWREERKVMDLQLLPDLTKIPLAFGLNQIPMRAEGHMSLIGKNCRMAAHGG